MSRLMMELLFVLILARETGTFIIGTQIFGFAAEEIMPNRVFSESPKADGPIHHIR